MEREEPLNARQVEEMARQHQAGGVAQSGWGTASAGQDRFPVLTAMSMTLRILGWLVVAGGVVLFFTQVAPWITCIIGAGQPQQPGGWGTPSCGVAFLILAPMIGSLVVGFFTIAFGEMIGVTRAIEGNTYQLLSRVEQAGYRNLLTGEGGQR